MADERERTSDGTTYDLVRASFGPHAANYTTSPSHADAAALARLVARVAPRPTDRLLDVGAGAGHAGLAFAPAVAQVVALDLTPEMLHEVRRNAAARRLANVALAQGAAESLPARGASCDLVLCRLTTHHFAALARAVGEMARVLASGGRLVVVDTTVPEDDELDRAINEIEWLRDPSHVRNWRPSEWRDLATAAGLDVLALELGYHDEGGGMDVADWTARIGTPPGRRARLEQRFREASPALVAALRIHCTPDAIRFALPRLTLIARKPPASSPPG